MLPPSVHRSPRAWRAALLAACAAALCAVPATAQEVIRSAGQVVEVRIADAPGTTATVCLESVAAITRRKRLIVEHRGGSEALATLAADRGPHCANFDPGEDEVTVRLEYHRLLVFPAELSPRVFAAGALRGKTVTFRWIRD